MKRLARGLVSLAGLLLIPACACQDKYVRSIYGDERHHPCHRSEKCCRPYDPKACECSQSCPCWTYHR